MSTHRSLPASIQNLVPLLFAITVIWASIWPTEGRAQDGFAVDESSALQALQQQVPGMASSGTAPAQPTQPESIGGVPDAPQAVTPGGDPRAVRRRSAAQPSQTVRRAVPAQQRVRRAPRPIRPARGQEEAVDLSSLGSDSGSSAPARPSRGSSPRTGTSMAAMNPHGPSSVIPNFKFYFDFLLKSWKGGGANTGNLSFDSFHQKMLVEFTPNQDFTFSASILGLDFYEVDYMVTPKVQLRWGKIWIPFDDMSPHNIFGGRLNTSKFHQAGEAAFLPDIWADLGVGVKWVAADSTSFRAVVHGYIVNGFGSFARNGSPVAGEVAMEYPNFGTTGATDNNDNKAIGGRVALAFGQRFSLGFSGYRGTYTSKAAVKSQGITIMGGDMQIRPTNTMEIRLGTVAMDIGLNPIPPSTVDSFTRGGTYVEFGQRFGFENRWKFLFRAGKSQNDNRVINASDKSLIGMTLLRNFGSFEGQFTYYTDTKKVPLKTATNYAAFRLVTAF